MLILLPPSEGKSAPDSGPRLDLAGLGFPELGPTRRTLVSALTSLCRTDPSAAATALGLGPRQLEEVRVNAELRRRACAPAIEIYTGVLFDALGYQSLTAAQQQRADEHVIVGSALWGLVRPDDLIPAYRLSGGTTLPELGSMRRAWHGPLAKALASLDGPVLDLRSGTYRDLAPLPQRDDWISIRVFEERNGRRTVVTHNNKATKGAIARAMVSSRRNVSSLASLTSALSAWGYRVERESTAPDTLDVIVG